MARKQERMQRTVWHIAAHANMLTIKKGNKKSLRALNILHMGQLSWS